MTDAQFSYAASGQVGGSHAPAPGSGYANYDYNYGSYGGSGSNNNSQSGYNTPNTGQASNPNWQSYQGGNVNDQYSNQYNQNYRGGGGGNVPTGATGYSGGSTASNVGGSSVPSNYSSSNYYPQAQSNPPVGNTGSNQYNYGNSNYGSQSGQGQGGYGISPPAPPPPPPGMQSTGGHGQYPQQNSAYGGVGGGQSSGGYHDVSKGGVGGPPSGMRNQSFRGGHGGGRNTGPGFNNKGRGGPGGYNSGGGGGFQGHEEMHDTIFVSGLSEEVNEDDLAGHFGSIGIIKIDKKTGKKKIWIYRDKISGKSKGEATITYDDPPTAQSAINWFNGKDFKGCKILVELAQRKASALGMQKGGIGGGGGGRGGPGGNDRKRNDGGRGPPGGDRSGPSGGPGRQGDWRCPNPSCNNNNFSWRVQCNRCQAPKPQFDEGGDRGGFGQSMSPELDSRRGGQMPPMSDRRQSSPGNMRGSGGRGGGNYGPPRNGGGMNDRGGNRGPPRGGGGPRGGNNGPMDSGRGRSSGPMRGSTGNRRPTPY